MKEVPSPPLNFNSVQILKNKNKEAQQAYHKRIEDDIRLVDIEKGNKIRANFNKYTRENHTQTKFDVYATKLVYQKKSIQDLIRSKIKKCDQARVHSSINKDFYQENGNEYEQDDNENEENIDMENGNEIENEVANDEIEDSLDPPDLTAIFEDNDLNDTPSESGCLFDFHEHDDDVDSVVSCVDDDVSISNSIEDKMDPSICGEEDDELEEADETEDHTQKTSKETQEDLNETRKTKDKIRKALWKRGEEVMSMPTCVTQREAAVSLIACLRKSKATCVKDIQFLNQ